MRRTALYVTLRLVSCSSIDILGDSFLIHFDYVRVVGGLWAEDYLLLRNSVALVYCEIRPALIMHPILLWLAFLDEVVVFLHLTSFHCLRIS